MNTTWIFSREIGDRRSGRIRQLGHGACRPRLRNRARPGPICADPDAGREPDPQPLLRRNHAVTPVDMQSGEPIYYGFGVMVLPNYYGANLRMHGGNVFGSSSSLIWAPDYTFADLVLFNGAASPDDAALCAYSRPSSFDGRGAAEHEPAAVGMGEYAGDYRGRYLRALGLGDGRRDVTYDGLEITATTVNVRIGWS